VTYVASTINGAARSGDHAARSGDHAARSGDHAARSGDHAARSGDGAVEVEGLWRSYGAKVVLRDLDFSARSGEFVALLGQSGCGKTTLLRTLAGLDAADRGRIEVPARRSVVFQEPRLFPWKRAWQNVVLGLPRHLATRDRAQQALAEVGLAPHGDSWPLTLSGGEAQRVALARALVREPRLLLLDEPFAALDALTRIHMHQLIMDLCARHEPATVLVTHDVDEALLLADRVTVMESGRIVLDVSVDLPHPRHRGSGPFEDLRAQLLRRLGVDVTRVL
jgi:sulfonate transport system ATP-binding protein